MAKSQPFQDRQDNRCRFIYLSIVLPMEFSFSSGRNKRSNSSILREVLQLQYCKTYCLGRYRYNGAYCTKGIMLKYLGERVARLFECNKEK